MRPLAKPSSNAHKKSVRTSSGFIVRIMPASTSASDKGQGTKKADVAEHPEVFHHVGLLINEPPGTAGLPFI
jgi:hypothetical protein